MLESVAADIRQPNHSDTDSQAAVDKAHQLLPIQKFLTSLKNDVKETADAIKAVSGWVGSGCGCGGRRGQEF
jgi:hypothetical protein